MTPNDRLSLREEATTYVLKEIRGTLLHAASETLFYGRKEGLRLLVSLIIADYEAFFSMKEAETARPEYEPPVITHIGNLHNTAEKCGPHSE